MKTLLVIDMQVGLFSDAPRFDARGVIERINALIAVTRQAQGHVVFVQHDGPPDDALAVGTPGWAILPGLDRCDTDPVIHKHSCDAFRNTALTPLLKELGARELVIAGCCTDFCVDTTVRVAASSDYAVIVAADAHTTADRPHLEAARIITHHNWMWENCIVDNNPIRVLPTAAILGMP